MKQIVISDFKEKYFCGTKNIVHLKEGDILFSQNEKNTKIYLVLEGVVGGFLNTEDGGKLEVFRSKKDMLVGFHSFFSNKSTSYADVIALEDSKLIYISYDDVRVKERDFLTDFLPIIVEELFERQVFAKKVMLDKEKLLINNHKKDKLAVLGQMAAGIAHELNNAIGIINGNASWIADALANHIEQNEDDKMFAVFNKAYADGNKLSSSEVRAASKQIEKKLNVASSYAKKVARLSMDSNKIDSLKTEPELNSMIDQMYYFWEVGTAIHDILLASKHATHVISSVKSLGISTRDRTDIDINKTIDDALVLIQEQTKGIDVVFEKDNLPIVKANDTELMQIWINIMKNACEALKADNIDNPKLVVKTELTDKFICIYITDNGKGIPDAIKEKIFQPSFTTKKSGLSFGLGLGLAVVQKHVNEYNGIINIESKVGETTFCIQLPLKTLKNE